MNDVVNKIILLADHDTPLKEAVERAWENYLTQLEGEEPFNIYGMFVEQIELPLLIAVMGYTGSNQTRAARVTGLSRTTLRKKLKFYDLL